MVVILLWLSSPSIDTSKLEFTNEVTWTFALSDSIGIRIYSDTRPHNLSIAELQKGLILIYKGIETIGEGSGLGVPVLQYTDGTYFSGSSIVYSNSRDTGRIIHKEFVMNRLPKRRFRNICIENRKLIKIEEYGNRIYRDHRNLRFLIMERFYQKIGFNMAFVETFPIGKVPVEYSVSKNGIKIAMDFTHIKRDGLKRIFVTNEQGSKFFPRYFESGGQVIFGRHIGAWGKITADYAGVTDLNAKVGFRLCRKNDSILYRGRENLKGIFDWVGLDYELNSSSLNFEYDIDVLGV